jgi:hypothetical protein
MQNDSWNIINLNQNFIIEILQLMEPSSEKIDSSNYCVYFVIFQKFNNKSLNIVHTP